MSERHFHEESCWEPITYVPCGEHHRHSWWCGGGKLSPKCPKYKAPPETPEQQIERLNAENVALKRNLSKKWARATAAERGLAKMQRKIEAAIARVRAHYPEAIFPDDGKTLDAKSARMARLTCDNVLGEVREALDAEEEEERIETAALLVDNVIWTLARPTRHHTLVQSWAQAHYKDGKNGRIGEHDQGFMTSTGRFVGRKKAAAIARTAGQVDETKRTDPQDTLFSEDLW